MPSIIRKSFRGCLLRTNTYFNRQVPLSSTMVIDDLLLHDSKTALYPHRTSDFPLWSFCCLPRRQSVLASSSQQSSRLPPLPTTRCFFLACCVLPSMSLVGDQMGFLDVLRQLQIQHKTLHVLDSKPFAESDSANIYSVTDEARPAADLCLKISKRQLLHELTNQNRAAWHMNSLESVSAPHAYWQQVVEHKVPVQVGNNTACEVVAYQCILMDRVGHMVKWFQGQDMLWRLTSDGVIEFGPNAGNLPERLCFCHRGSSSSPANSTVAHCCLTSAGPIPSCALRLVGPQHHGRNEAGYFPSLDHRLWTEPPTYH